MKRIGLLFFFICFVLHVSAQNEVISDSIRTNVLPEMKNYDGFLLDMNIMKLSAPKRPDFKLKIPDASKDYSFLFRPDPNVTYTQGLSNIFSPDQSTVYGVNPFGLTGFFSTPQNLQMGSFKLKNGMRLNTYGEYNSEGYKVYNRSALPWERNNFKGAFELKSANGSFGIRVEVQKGNYPPY